MVAHVRGHLGPVGSVFITNGGPARHASTVAIAATGSTSARPKSDEHLRQRRFATSANHTPA